MSLMQRMDPRFFYEEPPHPGLQHHSFDKYLRFLRRRYPIMLAAIVLAGLGGGVYLWVTQPIFTASATMLIDMRKGQGFENRSVLGDTPRDSTWLESEIGVLSLGRDKIGYAVARNLDTADLAKLVQPPPDKFGALLARFTGVKPASGGTESEPRDALIARAAGVIAGGLDIKRMGVSYLLGVTFSSPDPQLAAKVANIAADAFVAAEMDSKFQEVKRASDWLQRRYQTLGAQTSAAERAVAEFKQQHNIITTDGKIINDQQIGALTGRLAEARAKTSETHSKLMEIQSILQSDKLDPSSRTVSDSLQDPIITALRSKYLEMANREAEWTARFGAKHLAVVDLRNKEREILIAIREEIRRIAQTYQSDYEIAKRNQSALEAEVSKVGLQVPNADQTQLRALESSAESVRTFYHNFLLHYTEAVQQETSPFSETRVIAKAVGASQSFPSMPRILGLVALAGMGIGVGLGVLQDALDRAFRTKDQIRDTLDTECLAMIPVSKRRKLRSNLLPPPETAKRLERQRYMPLLGRRHIIGVDPPSLFTDAIGAIRLAADLRAPDDLCKVIGFTSSVPREGKSTIATAFAQLSAQVGGKGILVDLDLRHRWLTHALAPRAEHGLLSVAAGQAELEDVVWTDPASPMVFLPAVAGPGIANTCHLLSGAAMKRLFDKLRSEYDYVVVDLPPMLPVVDVQATTKLIDYYVFVVEWGQTRVDVARQCLVDAPSVHDKMLGVVLNKVQIGSLGRYDRTGSSYYTNRYFRKLA